MSSLTDKLHGLGTIFLCWREECNCLEQYARVLRFSLAFQYIHKLFQERVPPQNTLILKTQSICFIKVTAYEVCSEGFHIACATST